MHPAANSEATGAMHDLFPVFADPDHSTEESRFIIMGQSKQRRLW
jgi:hypothetical protein